MIRAWRIAKARHQAEAFSGAGGLHGGGRWHVQGGRIVYAASSLALAALEVFFHLHRAHAKIRWVVFEAEIPASVAVANIAPDQLPRTWRREPPPPSTRRMGTDWLRQSTTAVLRVPSAIIPTEYNYLFNPVHPDFGKIRIGAPTTFNFDSRLWK